ncbi:hypothetical protein [Cellulomonas hominis]
MGQAPRGWRPDTAPSTPPRRPAAAPGVALEKPAADGASPQGTPAVPQRTSAASTWAATAQSSTAQSATPQPTIAQPTGSQFAGSQPGGVSPAARQPAAPAPRSTPPTTATPAGAPAAPPARPPLSTPGAPAAPASSSTAPALQSWTPTLPSAVPPSGIQPEPDDELPVPRWDSVLAGATAAAEEARTSTAGSRSRSRRQDAATPVAPVEEAAVTTAGSRDVPEDALVDVTDEDAPRRAYPYTWLQMIVLALVAFVLGFLIILLGGRAAAGDEGTAAGPGTVAPTGIVPLGPTLTL